MYRAAQYVRMSTEHQQYSTENQGDKIREYAVRRNIEIVTSTTEIVQAEGLNPGRASTIARLVHLAPDVVEACLTDDSGIALEHLIRNGSLPLDWQQQRRMIQARS